MTLLLSSCLGDFNNALNVKDKKGGLPIPFSYIHTFKSCLYNCGLIESNLQGCKYTWQRRGVANNIDKVLVNYDFIMAFPNFKTVALPSAFSDHTPILLTFNNHIKQQKERPFRYMNNWCFLPGYLQCIIQGYASTTWGSVSYQFMHRLKTVKDNLKAWNKLRAQDNQINKLQQDFNSVFYQLD